LIKVEAIDHLVLRTVNTKAMLEFYCGVLNCPIERELQGLGLIQLRAGSALIDIIPVDSELGRKGGKEPSQDGRNLEHLCLRIVKAQESLLLKYLSENGIKAQNFEERYGADGYGRSIYVNDPEGNVVELKISNN